MQQTQNPGCMQNYIAFKLETKLPTTHTKLIENIAKIGVFLAPNRQLVVKMDS